MAEGLSPRGRGNPSPPDEQGRQPWSIPAWAGEPGVSDSSSSDSSVYPRVGGGTLRIDGLSRPQDGLSPRGRGNPGFVVARMYGLRSIPAWAGEPRQRPQVACRSGVYPRVGGGTSVECSPMTSFSGLSPRGRGNQIDDSLSYPYQRSIPAWAGEPSRHPAVWLSLSVYPRVGGGTVSHPAQYPMDQGLSPRGRGNHSKSGCRGQCTRSIPAWAGEPLMSWLRNGLSQVYPRVGGGTSQGRCSAYAPHGLSPRGRGNPASQRVSTQSRGSIPAWAGEPGCLLLTPLDPTVYPRVGGGTLLLVLRGRAAEGLSPRGRGNQYVARDRVWARGSIPAWAGEPSHHDSPRSDRRVYPRVGGGTTKP